MHPENYHKRKASQRDPLKLMQWAADKFPPIDLNNERQHVLELINEISRLRKELAGKEEVNVATSMSKHRSIETIEEAMKRTGTPLPF